MRRTYLRNRELWLAIGIALFIFSCWIFYDLHEARGGRSPLIIRMFTPT